MNELKPCPCCKRSYGINTEQEIIKADFNTRPARDEVEKSITRAIKSALFLEWKYVITDNDIETLSKTIADTIVMPRPARELTTEQIVEAVDTWLSEFDITWHEPVDFEKLTNAINEINSKP